MSPQVNQLKLQIVPILKKYSIRRAGLFGSFAKNKQTKNSDLDLLVEFDLKRVARDYFPLKFELEKKINRQVDLVEYDLLHPVIKDEVMLNQISLM